MLVDDEFSTGNTVLNTIRALHELHPRERYVIVALVDMRSPADRDRLTAFAAEIGARVDLVTRAAGTVSLPDGVLERGQALVAEREAEQTPPPEQAEHAVQAGRAHTQAQPGGAGAVASAGPSGGADGAASHSGETSEGPAPSPGSASAGPRASRTAAGTASPRPTGRRSKRRSRAWRSGSRPRWATTPAGALAAGPAGSSSSASRS